MHLDLDHRYILDEVALRSIRLDDCTHRYVGWLDDPRVNRYLETRWSTQNLDSVRSFVTSTMVAPDQMLLAIELNRVHVGNLKIGAINNRHGFAEVSYFVGDADSWGRGIATKAIALALQIASAELGLANLFAGVYEGNIGSIRALEKNGFDCCGRFHRKLLGPDLEREDHLWYQRWLEPEG